MPHYKMSAEFHRKIFPDIHMKINSAYISCIQLQKEQLELEKLKDEHAKKKSTSRDILDELEKKRRIIKNRKEEETLAIISIMEQTKKKIEKIEERSDQYRKLQEQMATMMLSLKERVEQLEQKKVAYLNHVSLYKPCKDLVTAVTKIWPTTIGEFELLKRFQALIKHKIRFNVEYLELYKSHESCRKKLLYETEKMTELEVLVLSNKLDELLTELKDVSETLQKEEEKFNRIMDTSSELEAALSDLRLGCLRLFSMTSMDLETYDSLEQLASVQEFGMLLKSVAESLHHSTQSVPDKASTPSSEESEF